MSITTKTVRRVPVVREEVVETPLDVFAIQSEVFSRLNDDRSIGVSAIEGIVYGNLGTNDNDSARRRIANAIVLLAAIRDRLS